MARLYRARGIVLSFREMTERDRLIIVFTKAWGKKTLLAKGIKREGAKLRYRLNPYSVVEVECVPGRSFDRVIAVNDVASLNDLLGEATRSLVTYSLALVVFDILETMGQESDPEPELFEEAVAICQTLADITPSEWDFMLVFMIFRLLFLSGVGVDLTRCVRSGAVKSPRFVLHLREGGLVSSSYADTREGDMWLKSDEIALLRAFQAGHFQRVVTPFLDDSTLADHLIQMSFRYLEYQGVGLRSLPFWRHVRYNVS
jgi:DNA repair protein RecO (recombination protein O)